MSRAGLSGCMTAAKLGKSTCLDTVGDTGRPERPVLSPLKTDALPDLKPIYLAKMKKHMNIDGGMCGSSSDCMRCLP